MGIQTRVAAPGTAYAASISTVIAATSALAEDTLKKTCDVKYILETFGDDLTDEEVASKLSTWPFWSSQVAAAQEAAVSDARTLLGSL